MLLVHLFVCFVRASFCLFSLPLGVGGWLRFVIVVVPGLIYFKCGDIGSIFKNTKLFRLSN